MVSKMETRPVWIVVDGVHRRRNARIQWVVIVLMTASVTFVQGRSVKVITLICSVKNLSSYVVVPTCNDGVKNGNETDVDCGGSCLPDKPCANGLTCNNGPDCVSVVCTSNICQGKHS